MLVLLPSLEIVILYYVLQPNNNRLEIQYLRILVVESIVICTLEKSMIVVH